LAAESGSLATRLQALGSGQGHVQILQTLDELRAVIQEMQRRERRSANYTPQVGSPYILLLLPPPAVSRTLPSCVG
jgi:hypothetical protein